ncbi:MAG: hypothetical protein AW07_01678 [Candidatus Accumulibacter sp. SK-11]|nr:MAG: hypothetical protein AW07_01678 [Candidatus Accumulibacter sp. SK-11]
MSAGVSPVGPLAAANSAPQASALTRVTQPDSALASVAKLAIVGVWPPFRGSWIVPPQPPLARSTKLGTLPAAIFSCSGCALIVVPSMNWLWVHTAAMVVISLMVTRAAILLPRTVKSAMWLLSPSALLVAGCPPRAVR